MNYTFAFEPTQNVITTRKASHVVLTLSLYSSQQTKSRWESSGSVGTLHCHYSPPVVWVKSCTRKDFGSSGIELSLTSTLMFLYLSPSRKCRLPEVICTRAAKVLFMLLCRCNNVNAASPINVCECKRWLFIANMIRIKISHHGLVLIFCL